MIYKVLVYASDTGWKVLVKKYETKETLKNFIINDYSKHLIAKNKINIPQSITCDTNNFVSRYMYVLEEKDIIPAIEVIISEIYSVLSNFKKDLDKTLSFAPKGKIDASKIVVEDTSITEKYTISDDMF